MLGVAPSDVKGPLACLQNTAFDRDDFFRLFQSINTSSDKPLKPEILKNVFNYSWDNLMRDISTIIDDYSSRSPELTVKNSKREESRNDSDAIQEILRIVRNWDNSRNSPFTNASPSSASSFEPLEKPSVEKIIPNLSRGILDAHPKRRALLSCPIHCVDDTICIISKYTSSSTPELSLHKKD